MEAEYYLDRGYAVELKYSGTVVSISISRFSAVMVRSNIGGGPRREYTGLEPLFSRPFEYSIPEPDGPLHAGKIVLESRDLAENGLEAWLEDRLKHYHMLSTTLSVTEAIKQAKAAVASVLAAIEQLDAAEEACDHWVHPCGTSKHSAHVSAAALAGDPFS